MPSTGPGHRWRAVLVSMVAHVVFALFWSMAMAFLTGLFVTLGLFG